MTRALHVWVRRWWQGEAGTAGAVLDVLTAPLEWVYGRAVARRAARSATDGGEAVPGLWVVSVGNLTVGGTGKTPMAAWVARTVADGGASAALVARGYGTDELALHRRWNPDVPVVADPDRRAAAHRARRNGATVAVLDDGFQHRRLARDVDLVLLAAEDPFPGRLLPRGPYREAATALARAHAVVVTRRTADEATARELATRARHQAPETVIGRVAFHPGGWRDLAGSPAPPPHGPLLAVAAVARPEAFARQVAGETGASVELVSFPDHHVFRESEVRDLRARAARRTVVVTEKDAVKLERHAAILGPVRVLAWNMAWEAGEEAVTRLVTPHREEEA